MAKPLAGKVALVTGASRGIGAAIARRLAEDGADVAITYASSERAAEEVVRDVEARGVCGASFRADAADAPAVRAMVGAVAKRFGRIDVLVNNAGVAAGGAVQDEADLRAIERMVAVNVGGVTACVRAALPHMPDGGRIVQIGSCLGVRTPWGGLADYAATKAAVAARGRAGSP